jgi:tricorn protease interacting factor F2/3
MTLPAPEHYALTLEPDLERFRFSGQTDILIRCGSRLSTVTLNVLDLDIHSCDLIVRRRAHACTFRCDPEAETLTVTLPRPCDDSLLLRIVYEGEINDKMSGFYRSACSASGAPSHIAVTQFQESDARRAFPCFDHPRYKASFDIEMVIDDHLTAVSNMDILETTALDRGKKRVVFHRTPRMSTYLVFFGVGEFKATVDGKDPRLRVVTLPEGQAYVATALEYGRRALRYCETYFGVPYPLAKMDLLAIPDFAFGAMENWGAITFRENLLLDDPRITSRSARERIFEVIAHEIVHQWFGNLVTPSDWKYLWLNESFATFFGYDVVQHNFADWLIEEQFLQGQTAPAMVRDSLQETLAIEIPGGEHVVINTATAPIIYSKGASILNQMKGYIGERDFRRGLHRYLESHAYANTASHHLWESFETVSGRPVSAMMQQWIRQPGYPLVEVQRHGDTLHITQQRFTYLPHPPRQTWPIPLQIALFDASGNRRERSLLMSDERIEVTLDSRTQAYKLNSGQTGFYRTAYLDASNLQRLGALAASGDIGSRDRWGLENDFFSLVKRGDRALAQYLAFLGHYRSETGYLPLSSIAANLVETALLVRGPLRQQVRSVGLPLLESVLERIGVVPSFDEPHSATLLRDQILWPALLLGSADTCRELVERFEQMRSGGRISPDIMKSVLQAAALRGGRRTLDWFIRRLEISGSEHERLNILTAMGCFADQDCLMAVRSYTLQKVPARNKFIPVVSMAVNPAAVKDLWPWFISRLADFESFHPLLFERVIAAIVPVAGLEYHREVTDFFGRYLQSHSQCADAIRLSLERLAVNRALRRRCGSSSGP